MNIPDAGLKLLQSDLRQIEERLLDDRFAGDLYRGLAGNRLSKDGETVAVSWKRAEEIVSGIRGEVGRPPVDLFQTGGESWLSDSVREELGQLGWQVEHPGTGDPVLADSFASPRPPDRPLSDSGPG